MEKEIVLEGGFGVVEVKNGKVVKKAEQDARIYLNREVIAYERMKERNNDIAICKFFESLVHEGRSPTDLSLTFSLTLEDAGTSLEKWIESQWFFDPISVLLHPLLDALEFLKNLGLVHADVHAGNICIARGAKGHLRAKFIDFGCSVVVRDEEEWPCHFHEDECLFIDPRTQLPSNQTFPPSKDIGEIELKTLCYPPLYRDPLSLIALAASHEGCLPDGLVLGNADDVYGLGMCIVRMLTMFIDCPWTEWFALDYSSRDDDLGLKMKVLGNILQYNPAWNSRLFRDLRTRIRPVSTEPEDVKKMETSVREIEAHLVDLYTLYPNFFPQLEHVYDAHTSDLVRSCVEPDRNRRYDHTSGETSLKRRKTKRPRRFVDVRAKDLEVQSGPKNRIHVRVGNCWIMTGIVDSGRMVWWNAARGMMTCPSTRVMKKALEMFISKVQKSDSSLKKRPCTEWPFDHSIQGEEWLKVLELCGLPKPSARDDTGLNVALPQSVDR